VKEKIKSINKNFKKVKEKIKSINKNCLKINLLMMKKKIEDKKLLLA
jgi:hypothetical protein